MPRVYPRFSYTIVKGLNHGLNMGSYVASIRYYAPLVIRVIGATHSVWRIVWALPGEVDR